MRSSFQWIGTAAIAGVSLFVLAFLTLPLLAVIPMSFSSSLVYELIPAEPSLNQYRTFFSDLAWRNALLNSVKVAACVAGLATGLGLILTLGLRKLSPSARPLFQGIFVLPQVVPSIVYAIAVYFALVQAGLTNSLFGLVLAHTVLAMPFVVLIVGSAVYGLDPALEEASQSLGSGPVRTFVKVVVPRLTPAILTGAFFSFQISFDEVILALFVTGASTKTFPVKIWDAIVYEISPILPAISTLIVVVPLMAAGLLFTLLRFRHHR